MSFEHLGDVLADEIGDGAQHGDLRRQKAAFLAQVSHERTVPWLPMLVAASFACAALIAGFWLWRTEEATFEINGVVGHAGQEVTAQADDVAIIFADGSVVRLLAGSTLRVEKVAVGRVLLRLARGGLAAQVRHQTPVKWDFVANGFDVRVVGTHLSIAVGEGLEVGVTEGAVRVSGQGLPNEGVEVRAGMKMSASAEGRYVVTTTEQPQTEQPKTEKPKTEQPKTEQPKTEQPKTDHREPTSDHREPTTDHRDPTSDPRAPTPDTRKSRPVPPLLPIDALVAKADAARVAGDSATARKYLLALRDNYPQTREATRAQFMLGRIAMELDHDPTSAAKAFAAYVKASPHGELIEEAYGRELEALRAANDMSAARDVAREYLTRYSAGDYTTLAHSLAGQ